jgi:hypothetical protein
LCAEDKRVRPSAKKGKKKPVLDVTYCILLRLDVEEHGQHFRDIPDEVWNDWEQANRRVVEPLKAALRAFLASLERRKKK